MGYYQAGDSGYYMAGGFGSFLKKAVKSVKKVVKSAGKVWTTVKPLVGAAVSVASVAYPGIGTISGKLAAGEKKVRNLIKGTRPVSQAVALFGNASLGVPPSQSTMGRTSQLLNPTAAPSGMPGEGSSPMALFYKQLTVDERATLLRALQLAKKG